MSGLVKKWLHGDTFFYTLHDKHLTLTSILI